MKLIALLLVVSCLHINAAVHSQSITLNQRDATLEEALQEIRNQTGYFFWYDHDVLKHCGQVSVHLKNASIEEALNALVRKKPIAWRIVGDQVISLQYVPISEPLNSNPAEVRVKQSEITGRVTDELGAPLPGVSVQVKGTTQGTQTDLEGNFSLRVTGENVSLVFSLIGYQEEEIDVGQRTVINVRLKSDVEALEEVVVTALGITKEAKALAYTTQNIKGEDLSRVKDMNYINSLAGKVAGAIITKGTMGPGSASRVLIRGNKSFTGSSSPLYVIDGVPSSIEFNPDDIESIQILPGASAAALYGSQAANGVVLITTKKGRKGVSTVDFSSSFTIEDAIDLPRLQTRYGRTDPQYNDSWGEIVENGSDGHLDEFFKTGLNAINSISFTSGNEAVQTYLSYANSTANGILPENKLSQHNFTLKVSSQYLDDRLSIDGAVNYVNRKIYNQNSIGGYSAITGVYSFPIDDDWSKYSGRNFEVWDPVRQAYVQNWPYIRNETFPSQNPYWVQHRNQTDDFSKKTVASFVGKYQALDWLDIQARLTYDFSEGHWEKRNYASTQGTIEGPNGGYGISESKSEGLFADLLIMVDKPLNQDLTISGMLGASDRIGKSAGLGLSSTVPTSLTFPNFFSVYALNGLFNKSEYLHETETRAVFGSATLGYKSRLFLDLTARNEWTSTVSIPFFYPSAGLSYILRDGGSDVLPYAKLRASYSEVGNSLPFGIDNLRPPYALDNAGNIIGRGTLPYFDGTDSVQLKPERTRSFEFGTDLRFFNGKLSLNVTYYNARTFDQVFQIQAPAGAGAANFWINGGVIDNRGIEGVLSYNTTLGDVRWQSTLNFSHNKNRILELSDRLNAEYFSLSFHSHGGQVGIRLKRPVDGEYGAFGDMYGHAYVKDENGNYQLNDEGLPLISTNPDQFLGNANPDFLAGINNQFAYRNFTLSFLVDSRFGGSIFNRTELWLDYKGLSERTGKARDRGGVMVNGELVEARDFYLNQTGAGQTPAASEYFFSATNIRMRELSFGYDVPTNSRAIGNLNISFIARNLFFLYKEAPFDPEIGVGTSPGNEGHADFALPSTRSFGLSLKATFSANRN